MPEGQKTVLGPAIKNEQQEERRPYQEQKEQWGKKKFDVLIAKNSL